MSVGDAETDRQHRDVPGSATELKWIGDRESSSRMTVFDPRPARLDEAWIEADADAIVALRAMR